MSEYIRVRDYREQQLLGMPNVEVFRESRLTAADVHAVDADHVAIATGARWRVDRFDGEAFVPVAAGAAADRVLTPDDIMNGHLPDGPTIVFDDDNYYMGGVIAERIRALGLPVTYVTAADNVSRWAAYTAERGRIQARLIRLGIGIETARTLVRFDGAAAVLACAYGGPEETRPADWMVMVTARRPNDAVYRELVDGAGSDGLPFTLTRIGDCEAPAIIAAAVQSGHRFAQDLGGDVDPDLPLRHDRVDVGLDAVAVPATRWK